MAQENLINPITNVLGLSVKQREVLSNDGYDTISTIIHVKHGKIREWCTTKSKLTTTRGGAFYGDQAIKCLQALSWWAISLTLRGTQVVLSEFESK